MRESLRVNWDAEIEEERRSVFEWIKGKRLSNIEIKSDSKAESRNDWTQETQSKQNRSSEVRARSRQVDQRSVDEGFDICLNESTGIVFHLFSVRRLPFDYEAILALSRNVTAFGSKKSSVEIGGDRCVETMASLFS